MVNNIIFVGSGGLAKELYDYAKASLSSEKYVFKGYLSKERDYYMDKVTLLGHLGMEKEYKVDKSDIFLVAIGKIENKKKIIEVLKNKKAEFLQLVHPTAIISGNAKLGIGSVIGPYCIVNSNAVLGDHVFMNIFSSVGHDAKIGNYSIMSPYATLNGFSILDDEVFLGTHSTITAYCKVGKRTKVSANSSVIKDVKSNSIVYGVPGKIVADFYN